MLKQLRRSDLAGASLWEDHWREFNTIRFDAESLRWDGFLDLVDSRLPHGPVLEAGCGLGRYLLYLRSKRTVTVGIDFAREPLRTIVAQFGPQPLVAGDLLRLPFRSNTFATILCLGVIEHFVEGPGAVLAELARVLRPGGVLIVTVPYANALKRWRARRSGTNVIPAYAAEPAGWRFYQFCFTPAELRRAIESVGLMVVHERRTGSLFGLAGRFARRKMARSRASGQRADESQRPRPDSPAPTGAFARRLLKETAFRTQPFLPASLLAHMTLAVARKRPGPETSRQNATDDGR